MEHSLPQPPRSRSLQLSIHYHRGSLVVVLLIAISSLLYYPGTQYLSSDTQIYTPLIEHARDPALYANDLLAQYPHLGFTLYDEMVNAVQRATGLSTGSILHGFQGLFRVLHVLAAYLMGYAITRRRTAALWIAAAFPAAGFVAGPAVAVTELEAVPRGFTFTLSLLAAALVAVGRPWAASWTAGLGFLFQGAPLYPFLLCFTGYSLFAESDRSFAARLRPLLPLAICLAAVLGVVALERSGGTDTLARVPAWLREIHLIRASYNYPSTWLKEVIQIAVCMGALCAASWFTLRHSLPKGMRWFVLGIPLIGVLSIPVAWVLMEKAELFLMAQAQPARALGVMYVFVLPFLLGAGAVAAERKQWLAACVWTVAGTSVCFLDQLLVFVHSLNRGMFQPEYFYALLAAAASLAGLALHPREPRLALVLLLLAGLLPSVLLREAMHHNPLAADARTAEVAALADWARQHTDRDAVFAFPGFGRSALPGVFRSQAQRAVYVDWKAGGQVNFSIELARIWWQRWNEVMTKKSVDVADLHRFGAAGIGYAVVPPAIALNGSHQPVYRNQSFVVYAVTPGAAGE